MCQKWKKAVRMNGAGHLHQISKTVSQIDQKLFWIGVFLPLCGRIGSSGTSFQRSFSYLAFLPLPSPPSCSRCASCLDVFLARFFQEPSCPHQALGEELKWGCSSLGALISKLCRLHFLAAFLSQQGIFQIRSRWRSAQNQNSFILFKFDHSTRKGTWTLTSLAELLSASAYGPVGSSQLSCVKSSQLHQLSGFRCFSWNVDFAVPALLPLESSDLVRLGGFIFKADL